MTPADLLRSANFDPWESVESALKGLPKVSSERSEWLVQHIWEMKLEYAQLIAKTLSQPAPPELDLEALMVWEVDEAASLTLADLAKPVQYGRRTMSVGDILLLNARHSVWHAGQLAALI